jgi:hypothetical protein
MGMNIPESATPYGRERIRREHLEAAIRNLLGSLPTEMKGGTQEVATTWLIELQEAMRD